MSEQHPENRDSVLVTGQSATLWQRMWARLTEPSARLQDTAVRQRSRILASFLVVLLPGLAVLGLLSIFISDEFNLQSNPFPFLALLTLVSYLVAYWLNQRGFYQVATFITIAILSIMPFVAIMSQEGVTDPGQLVPLVWLILPLALSMVLLPGAGSLVVVALYLGGLYWVSIVRADLRFIDLVGVAGLLGVIAFLLFLFTYYQRLVAAEQERQLEKSKRELKQAQVEVEAKTRDLILATEISKNLGHLEDINKMLGDAVELICARFNIEYAQIYLADRSQQNLILRAGAGSIGHKLVQQSHRLPITLSSINGTAFIEKESVVVKDTITSAIFQANPLLPNIRAEMAVPLLIGQRAIGVLDLQSERPEQLSAENLPIFEAIAGQLAIAIDNVRLLSESQQNYHQLENRTQQVTFSSWQTFLDAIERGERIGFAYDRQRTIPWEKPLDLEVNDDSLTVPIMVAGEPLGNIQIEGTPNRDWTAQDVELAWAVAQQIAQQIENLRLLAEADRYRTEAEQATQRLTRQNWEGYLSSASTTSGYLYDQQRVRPLTNGEGADGKQGLRHSLTVHEVPIGEIEVVGAEGEEVEQMVTAVTRQLSAHLENLRLTEQTEAALAETADQAKRLSAINQVAQAVSRQLDLEQLLEAVYQEVRRVMAADAFFVGLYEHQTNLISYPIVYDKGQKYSEEADDLDHESRVYQVVQTGEPYLLHRTPEEIEVGTGYRKNMALGAEEEVSCSLLFVPLQVGEKVIGVLSVQSYAYNSYSDNDVILLGRIANHVAIATENVRLFEAAQERAKELAVINEVAETVSRYTDTDQLLETIYTQIQQVLAVDAFIIGLYEPETDLLHYPILYDDGQRYDAAPSEMTPTGSFARTMRGGKPILTLRSEEEVAAIVAEKQQMTLLGDVAKVSASLLYVPLTAGEQAFGALTIQSYDYDAYDQNDVDLLVGMASHVGVALENARLFEQTQTSLEETELLYTLGAQINMATDISGLLDILSLPGIAPEADSAGLFIVESDEQGQPEVIELLDNWSGQRASILKPGVRFNLDQFPLFQPDDLDSETPLLVEDIPHNENLDESTRAIFQQLNTQSVAIVPLVQTGKWLGILFIRWQTPYRFPPNSIRLYQSLARQMSTAFSNQLLFAETQERAQQLERLAEVETELSQAESAADILVALTKDMAEDAALTLTYVSEEDGGQPTQVSTVAHWAEGRLQQEDLFLDKPFEIDKHAGLNLGVQYPDQATFIEDITDKEELPKVLIEDTLGFEYQAVIIVPLRSAGRWQGFLTVKWPTAHPFTTDEYFFWSAIREPLAAVVASQRSYQAQQETLAEVQTLYNASTRLNGAITLEDTLLAAVAPAIEGHANRATLWRFDLDKNGEPEWQELITMWERESDPELDRDVRFRIDDYPLSKLWMYSAGAPVLIEDIDQDNRVDQVSHKILADINVKATVYMPLSLGQRLVGLINIRWETPQSFSRIDERLYQSLSVQAAAVVESRLLFQQAQARAEELSSINSIAQNISQQLELEQLLETVYRQVKTVLDADAFHIGLYDRESDLVNYPLMYEGEAKGQQHGVKLYPGSNSYRVVHTGEPIIQHLTEDELKELKRKRPPTLIGTQSNEIPASMMYVPLRTGRHVNGVMSVQAYQPNAYHQPDLTLLNGIANYVAVALENVRLFEQTQQALTETAVLYQSSAALSTAQSFEQTLDVLRRHTMAGQSISNVSLMLFNRPWQGDDVPERADVLAYWPEPEDGQELKLSYLFADYPSAVEFLRPDQAIVIENVDKDPLLGDRLRAMLQKGFAARSVIFVPLVVGGQWIGYVNAMYPERINFTDTAIRRATAIAQQAAVTIQSLRNLNRAEEQAEAAQRRSDELAVLNEMGRHLTATVNSRQILLTINRYTSQLMETNELFVAFYDEELDEVDIRVFGDEEESVDRSVLVRRGGQGITEHVIRNRQPLLIRGDIRQRAAELGIQLFGRDALSWLGVPMIAGNKVIGMIAVQNFEDPHKYDVHHRDLLTAVAGQAAIAIENARLFEQIQARARREQILREVTAKVRGAVDVDSVMRTAVKEIGQALGRQTYLYLGQPEEQDSAND